MIFPDRTIVEMRLASIVLRSGQYSQTEIRSTMLRGARRRRRSSIRVGRGWARPARTRNEVGQDDLRHPGGLWRNSMVRLLYGRTGIMKNHKDAIALGLLIIGLFGWLKLDIQGLEQRMDQRFLALEGRMSSLEQRVARIEGALFRGVPLKPE